MTDLYAYDEARMREGIAAWQKERPATPKARATVRVIPPRGTGFERIRRPVQPPVQRSSEITAARAERKRRRRGMAQVVDDVCVEYGVTLEDLKERTRVMRVSRPRQIAMYLAHRCAGASLNEIGRYFDKHHTSVYHSVKVVTARAKSDQLLQDRLKRLGGPSYGREVRQ
jgi:hypothetical protein